IAIRFLKLRYTKKCGSRNPVDSSYVPRTGHLKRTETPSKRMAGRGDGLSGSTARPDCSPGGPPKGSKPPHSGNSRPFTTGNNDCGLRLCRVYARAPGVTTTTRSTRPERGAHELSCG